VTAPTLVGPLLQIFFTDHLVAQRRLSLQTVASYRDTFRLLLQFVHRETGIGPAVLSVPGLDDATTRSSSDSWTRWKRTAATRSHPAICGSRRYARSIVWSHCVILRASALQLACWQSR
jgi:integrase/recombinase XerD